MRQQLLIVLILLLNPLSVFAEINECKTDVYFANGILTEDDDAEYNALEILKPAIIDQFGINYYTQHIGKVDYAYNRTNGAVMDSLESLLQKVDGTGIENIHKYVKAAHTLAGLMTMHAHDTDLDLQIEKYKNSIKAGHKVLVVAHSQGNLFALEGYTKLCSFPSSRWECIYILPRRSMGTRIKYESLNLNYKELT